MSDGEIDDSFLWRNLPPGIISQVLSLLPLKSLCRFKCVSHSWNSLISSSYFARTHISPANTNNPQNAILISISNALYSVDFADLNPTAKKLDFPLFELSDNRLQVLSSCNGLLLFTREDNSNFLWNPSTGEYKKLPFFTLDPNCGFYYNGHGIGYDSSTDDYKVVMFISFLNIAKVAVYSLKTDAWRRIEDSDFPMDPSTGVYFNGRLHWLWRFGHLNGGCSIVAFGLSDAVFKEVQLPALFGNYEIEYSSLQVVGGCLCFIVCPSCDRIEVWMMKEYGVRESWTRLIMIDNPGMYKVNLLSLLSEDDFVLYFFHGRSVGDKLAVYNTKKETLRDMVIHGTPTSYTVGATYVETLVSPHTPSHVVETT